MFWLTADLERTAAMLGTSSLLRDDPAPQFLPPLDSEHFNLTGDYHWRWSAKVAHGEFKPLRRPRYVRDSDGAGQSSMPTRV